MSNLLKISAVIVIAMTTIVGSLVCYGAINKVEVIEKTVYTGIVQGTSHVKVELDKEIYNNIEEELVKSFKAKDTKVNIKDKLNVDEARNYFREIKKQHPEIDAALERKNTIWSVLGKVKYIEIAYRSGYDESNLENLVDYFISGVNKDWTDEQKAKAIAEFVGSRVTYSDEVRQDLKAGKEIIEYSNKDIQTAKCLLVGDAACYGYSSAFKYIADKIGLESRIIFGYALGYGTEGKAIPMAKEEYSNHAWIQIKLDGDWYHIDPTWMDGDSLKISSNQYYEKDGYKFRSAEAFDEYLKDKYFKLTNEEISITHPWWLEYRIGEEEQAVEGESGEEESDWETLDWRDSVYA